MGTPSVVRGSSWRLLGIATTAGLVIWLAAAAGAFSRTDDQQTTTGRGTRGQGAGVQQSEAQAKLLAEFMVRINEYVALHKKHEDTLPRIGDKASPQEMDRHQRALLALISKARAGAKQGDIFTPPVQVFIRTVTRRAFSGPDGKNLVGMIMDENPVGLKIAVNQKYPTEVPLSTMPPDVLAALPKLPEDLEYRFVGDRLILYDVHAQMVVDWVDNVLPVDPTAKPGRGRG
jgi:hypothetical protein